MRRGSIVSANGGSAVDREDGDADADDGEASQDSSEVDEEMLSRGGESSENEDDSEEVSEEDNSEEIFQWATDFNFSRR